MITNTCKNKNCGCKDTGLTTPAPCSCNVVTCPPPDSCPETFNDCCVIHTGDPIVNMGIETGDPLCVIIQKLVIFTAIGEKCIDGSDLCKSVVNFQTTNIGTTTVSLYWNPIVATPAVVTYQVEYSTDNATWTPLIFSTNSVTLTGLTANTKYYVKVTTGCDGEYKCESVTISFTTNSLTV
jgi:hypothetical protein